MFKFINCFILTCVFFVSCVKASDPIYSICGPKHITGVTFKVTDNIINGVYYQRKLLEDLFTTYPFRGVVHVNVNNLLVFEITFVDKKPTEFIGTSLNEVAWAIENGTRLYIPIIKNTPTVLPMTTIERFIKLERTSI